MPNTAKVLPMKLKNEQGFLICSCWEALLVKSCNPPCLDNSHRAWHKMEDSFPVWASCSLPDFMDIHVNVSCLNTFLFSLCVHYTYLTI